jgi:hypothetical protein
MSRADDSTRGLKERFIKDLRQSIPMRCNTKQFWTQVEESWETVIGPEVKRLFEVTEAESIRWTIALTKLLKDIKPSDIPRGLSAEDIAIDGR